MQKTAMFYLQNCDLWKIKKIPKFYVFFNKNQKICIEKKKKKKKSRIKKS